MNFSEIIFYLFATAAGFQIVVYALLFGKLAFLKKKSIAEVTEPVSVVIAARNEENNLLENLPSILEQSHPDFEVIVVDDCSYDDSQDVLRAFKDKYDNLKVTYVKETEQFKGGKKFAVTMGMKAAKNDMVVLTDADCKPASSEWLNEVCAGFNSDKQIVLGYGGYEKSGGLLNMLIRFDAIYVAIQYLSFALAGIPYMGVGRNLAYRKSLFFKNKGFASHQHIASGDDDLFVNETSNSNNTNVVIGLSSKTVSKPKASFADWLHQKRRHLTTGSKYKLSHLVILGLISGSVVVFYAGFVTLMISPYLLEYTLGIFGLRLLVQLLIFQQSSKKIGEDGIWYCAPLLEILMLFIYPVFALANMFIKPHRWNRI